MAHETRHNEKKQRDWSKMSKKIHVVIDDREGQDNIESLLAGFVQHPDVSSFSVNRLSSGDILAGDVAIERKTPTDFCSSITGETRNIFDQVDRMSQEYDYSAILIEGDMRNFDTLKYSNLPAESVRGVMARLFVTYGVPTFMCSTQENLVDLSVRLGRKSLEDPSSSFMKGSAARKQAPTFVRMLATMPSVGQDRAYLIADHYSSIESLLGASKSDLMKLDGIGEKTAENIYYSLR